MVALGIIVAFLAGRVGPAAIESLASPWTAQLWALTMLVLAVAWILRDRASVVALGVVALWSSVLVLPAIIPHGAHRDPPTLTVASANVLVANQPDAAALDWIRSLDVDVLGIVECNAAWLAAAESARDDGRPRWPYAIAEADDTTPGGVALLSRYPIRDALVERPPDGVFRMASAIIDHPEGAIRVFVVHPVPPVRPRWTTARNAELRWLADRVVGERERATPLPTVILGDLNETPFGKAYASFLLATGVRSARTVAGFAPTWPTRLDGQAVPWFLRIPIDHCLVSPELAPVRFTVGPDIGSDHLPVIAHLRLLSIPRPGAE